MYDWLAENLSDEEKAEFKTVRVPKARALE